MVTQLFIFAAALSMVLKGATLATKYAARLAESFQLSKYAVGFIIVAIISILPETFIAINAAIEGVPSFGLGMLFGSNIADLTLVFAVIILFVGRSVKVESKILKNHVVYPFMLLLPLVLGINGHYSRMEGLALIIAGAIFYVIALKNGMERAVIPNETRGRAYNVMVLLGCMALMLTGAHFTVTAATSLASHIGINPILIGMLVVGLGTTLPELFFSLKAHMKHNDSLAVGDILGTVLADATIVVGVLAVVNPFVFQQGIVYITGMFMVGASFVLFSFMRTGRSLSRREALLLIGYWLFFVFVEFIANA